MPKTVHGTAVCAALTSLAIIAAPIQTAHSQAARPSTPVTVNNTTTNPVPSTVVNPADIAKALGIQQPVTFSLTFSAESGVVPTSTLYTVPSNQRLIIEYASGSCNLANGANLDNLVIEVHPGSNFFPVNLPPLSTSGNFAHTVKIYADPASIIGLNTNGSGGAFNCVATFSGQLVDVP
jgi:AraC-like DNA-binding protein